MLEDLNYIPGDDIVITSPLQELSIELLEECIKTQIQNPFLSSVDFTEQFREEYEKEMDGLDEEADEYQLNQTIAWNFFHSILELLNEKFQFELDFDKVSELNLDGICNFAEGMYTFFILKYTKNIAKYLTKLIIANEDTLGRDLIKNGSQNNISYSSFSEKLTKPEYVMILSNITEIINTVKHMEVEPIDFISYFNDEKFEVAMVKHGIQGYLILGNFIPSFLSALFAENLQNDVYDDIVSTVQFKLYKRYKKKEPLKVDFQPEEEKEEEKKED